MNEFTRRQVMEMSFGAFLTVAATVPRLAHAAQEANALKGFRRPNERINWDAFVEAVAQLAERQRYRFWDQHGYVSSVAELAKRMELESLFRRRDYRPKRPGVPEFVDLCKKATFQMTLISFEKGEAIPHHDHPNMTGVIYCATGLLAVNNYEVLDRQGNSEMLLLKHVGHEILAPGRTSTLTATRANIHRVVARSFCEVIDIFTPPYNDERLRRTRWYKVYPTPNDSSLFHATF